MWCNKCKHDTPHSICELCGGKTEYEPTTEIHWCKHCNIPVIKMENDVDIDRCPICGGEVKYFSSDLRVVFPEERLLIEILFDKPLFYQHDSVWANNNRYYVNGNSFTISSKHFKKYSPEYIIKKLEEYRSQNSYDDFEVYISRFIEANRDRLRYRIDEAHSFIKREAANYPTENVVLSFSGGKDSTVTADLADIQGL